MQKYPLKPDPSVDHISDFTDLHDRFDQIGVPGQVCDIDDGAGTVGNDQVDDPVRPAPDILIVNGERAAVLADSGEDKAAFRL